MTDNSSAGAYIKHKGYILVQVPELAAEFSVWPKNIMGNESAKIGYWLLNRKSYKTIDLPPGTWQLIGLSAELTERQKWDIIERSSDGSDSLRPWFRNYEEEDIWTRSCTESFDSLLRSHNLNENQTVILKLIEA